MQCKQDEWIGDSLQMEELRAFGNEEASPAQGTSQKMEGNSSDSDVQHSAGKQQQRKQ